MKNFFKFLGIISLVLVIGFSMAACKDDDGGDDNKNNNSNNNNTGGSFAVTITGLASQNGKYVSCQILHPTEIAAVTHNGAVRYDGTTLVRALIANGTAKLDLYDLDRVKFTGNLSGVRMGINIFAAEKTGFSTSNLSRYLTGITITNGGTTLDYSAGSTDFPSP